MRIVPVTEGVHSVQLDAVESGRAIYRLTLECGCVLWEHRPLGDPAPCVGEPVSCYHEQHSAIVRARHHTTNTAQRARLWLVIACSLRTLPDVWESLIRAI